MNRQVSIINRRPALIGWPVRPARSLSEAKWRER